MKFHLATKVTNVAKTGSGVTITTESVGDNGFGGKVQNSVDHIVSILILHNSD